MPTDQTEPTQIPFSAFPRWMTAGGNKAFHNFYNDYSHITDPNMRRRMALTEIDKVPFGLYHVQAVMVAGVGFFIDSYAVYSLNLITTLLGVVFWSGSGSSNGYGGNNGWLPSGVSHALKMSTIAGMIVGQTLFGCLADLYGRRKMYGVELGLILVSTLGFSISNPSPVVTSTGVLVFWRVMLGIAIGGEYPNSSVITSEFAPTRWRGAMVAAVNGMQALGQLFAAVIALITHSAFQEAYSVAGEPDCGDECRTAADRSWRLIAGVGALPALLALYYRITIPETPRYTFDVEHDIVKGDADINAFVSRRRTGDLDSVQQARLKAAAGAGLHIPKASWQDFKSYMRQPKNWKCLIGTTGSWFLVDIIVYGLGLNSTTLLQAIGYARGSSLHEKLRNQAVGTIILAAAGAIPGYLSAILTVDTFGRKSLQFFGFFVLIPLFCVLGFAHTALNEMSRLALYVVVQFVLAAGPGTTTFIVPAEVYPTRYRATGHGVSAASGKTGALVAQGISMSLLSPSVDSCDSETQACDPVNLDRLFQVFALVALLGVISTLLVPITTGVTLEELSGEPPTSYNAGRNGSIGVIPRSRWNIFGGGQPAGFNYPRSYVEKSASKRATREARTKLSPEGSAAEPASEGGVGSQTPADPSRTRRPGGFFWRTSGGAERVNGRAGADSNVDADVERGPAGQMPKLEVPNWGAGWGRIDRGNPRPRMESIQLEDLSNLLTAGGKGIGFPQAGAGARPEAAAAGAEGGAASPGSAVSPGHHHVRRGSTSSSRRSSECSSSGSSVEDVDPRG